MSLSVSIHAPTRGATRISEGRGKRGRFQSTLPRGERPPMPRAKARSSSFNPRSHAGSDKRIIALLIREAVSIHAPTRGATIDRFSASRFRSVSIHAPTRGATALEILSVFVQAVSIHAPTRERAEQDQTEEHGRFNPRSHAGSDDVVTPVVHHAIRFQSTLPRGERPPRHR